MLSLDHHDLPQFSLFPSRKTPEHTFWVGCWIKLLKVSASMYVKNVVPTAATRPVAVESEDVAA
jgi:hypothetical protein